MFYEEARELLIGLEEGLMDLERRQSDRAHLDKTFRAAHSLKGAAAMVGLGSIAEFTHGIEAVLDRIRSGGLAVDSDIITTLLEARDHLAAMVESEAARSPIPPSGELSHRLISLLRGPVLPEAPGLRCARDERSGGATAGRGIACCWPDTTARGDPRRESTAQRAQTEVAKKAGLVRTPKPRRCRPDRAASRAKWTKLPSRSRLLLTMTSNREPRAAATGQKRRPTR